MSQALIGLGSNQGDRRQILDAAIQQISRLEGVALNRKSTWHATKAIGGPIDQPDFLNGAALLETSLAAEAFLAHLQRIENELGRTRDERWSPRTIDLDLLLVDDLVVESSQLKLPHPRMAFRRFVLEPAAEVAGSMRHPIIGWSIAELLDHLQTARAYVAISSNPFAPANDLARTIAGKIDWKFIEPSAHQLELLQTNSPSLAPATAIEFLADFAGKISSQQFANQNFPVGSMGAISPAWIEDVLAIGDVLWPGVLDEAWRRVGAAVVPPKLLVVLPNSTLPSAHENPPITQFKKSIEQARLKRARRPGVGPVLWLDEADFATFDHVTAEQEIIAAIQAMK